MGKKSDKGYGNRGKAGLPKTGGNRKGSLLNTPRLNTHDMIKELRGAVHRAEQANSFTLVGKIFSMIADPKVENFVKKDLLLGTLGLITPKMKAVEMNIEMPPTQIMFQTNVTPAGNGNGSSPDQLSGVTDLPQISRE